MVEAWRVKFCLRRRVLQLGELSSPIPHWNQMWNQFLNWVIWVYLVFFPIKWNCWNRVQNREVIKVLIELWDQSWASRGSEIELTETFWSRRRDQKWRSAKRRRFCLAFSSYPLVCEVGDVSSSHPIPCKILACKILTEDPDRIRILCKDRSLQGSPRKLATTWHVTI